MTFIKEDVIDQLNSWIKLPLDNYDIFIKDNGIVEKKYDHSSTLREEIVSSVVESGRLGVLLENFLKDIRVEDLKSRYTFYSSICFAILEEKIADSQLCFNIFRTFNIFRLFIMHFKRKTIKDAWVNLCQNFKPMLTEKEPRQVQNMLFPHDTNDNLVVLCEFIATRKPHEIFGKSGAMYLVRYYRNNRNRLYPNRYHNHSQKFISNYYGYKRSDSLYKYIEMVTGLDPISMGVKIMNDMMSGKQSMVRDLSGDSNITGELAETLKKSKGNAKSEPSNE